MISGIAIALVKKGLVKKIISELGINKDNIDELTIEQSIVNWLNDCIDIPFLSEKTEEEMITAVLSVVKSLIADEL